MKFFKIDTNGKVIMTGEVPPHEIHKQIDCIIGDASIGDYLEDGIIKTPPPPPSPFHVFDYVKKRYVIDMQLLRDHRNKLLAESDWTQLPDAPVTDKQAWQRYRQALRDLPNTISDDTPITIPEKPQ